MQSNDNHDIGMSISNFIRCVTTMDQNYYQSIGKIMICTWLENFPDNYKLHLYLENFYLDFDDERIIIEPWEEIESLYKIWQHKRFSNSEGHQKFTKKALSQIAMWKKYSGKMLWLDADTFSVQRVPEDFFDQVIETYPLASWGSEQFESGTVFLNTEHPNFDLIRDIYESIYIGDLGLPEGQRWYDGELLGWACVKAGSNHLDLWKHCDFRKTSTPLNRSWIGNYIRHMKAKQKNTIRETLITDFNRPDLVKLLDDEIQK